MISAILCEVTDRIGSDVHNAPEKLALIGHRLAGKALDFDPMLPTPRAQRLLRDGPNMKVNVNIADTARCSFQSLVGLDPNG
jgi:hypothetical protein